MVARFMTGRSEVAIKNRWNLLCKLAKKNGEVQTEVVPLATHRESERNRESGNPCPQPKLPALQMTPIEMMPCANYMNDDLHEFFKSLNMDHLGK